MAQPTKSVTGAKPTDWKCLRCGHDFVEPYDKSAPLIERQCPKCRSNSVRRVPKNPKK